MATIEVRLGEQDPHMNTLFLVVVEMATGVLMAHNIDERAWDALKLTGRYQTTWRQYECRVKYAKWLDLTAVRAECQEFLVATGGQYAV